MNSKDFERIRKISKDCESYIYTSHYTFWTQISPGPTALALWANFFRFEICCLHDFFQITIFAFSKIFLHNQSNDQNVTI